MRILVVNPNTTASMTAKISAAAIEAASPGTEIMAVTSAMGPASIEGYYDEAFAVPGLIQAIRQAGAVDAVVIACFDDTGLDAARAFSDAPVIGICEAGLTLAGMIAARVSVVTTLARSLIPIEHLVHRYGFSMRTKVRAADIPVLALEDENSGALTKLRSEIESAIAHDQAEAIVLGCAGMTDLARQLQNEFGLPVIDGVGAAVKQAEALVSLGLTTSRRGAYAQPLQKSYSGVLAQFQPV